MLNVNLKNKMNLIEKKINGKRFSSQRPLPQRQNANQIDLGTLIPCL